jgi:hypothetical protein
MDMASSKRSVACQAVCQVSVGFQRTPRPRECLRISPPSPHCACTSRFDKFGPHQPLDLISEAYRPLLFLQFTLSYCTLPAGRFHFSLPTLFFTTFLSFDLLFFDITMRSLTVLVAILFAFVATSYASSFPVIEARKDSNATRSQGGDNTKMACKEMRQLTALTSLASNQTKLDELVAKGKLDTAKVDALKKKAADASTKLQTMSSNTTLTSECAAIDAQGQMKQQCKQMKRLQKLAKLASNTTTMDAFAAKKNLNSTQVDGLKDKLQKADTKLKTLEANATLTDFCKQMKQGKQAAGAEGEFCVTGKMG